MKTFNTPISFKLREPVNYREMQSKQSFILPMFLLGVILIWLCCVYYGQPFFSRFGVCILPFILLCFYINGYIEKMNSWCDASTCTFYEDKVVFHFHFDPFAVQTFLSPLLVKDLAFIDKVEEYQYAEISKFHLFYDEKESLFQLKLNKQSALANEYYHLYISDRYQPAKMQKVLKHLYNNKVPVEERNAASQKTYLLKEKKEKLPEGYFPLDFFEDRIVQYFGEKTEEQEKIMPLASFWYKIPSMHQPNPQTFYFKEMQGFRIYHQFKTEAPLFSLETTEEEDGRFSISFKVNEQNVGYHLWIKDNQTVADMQMRLRHLYDLGMNIQENNSKGEVIYLLYPRNQHIEQKYLDLIEEIGEKEGEK